ncbi:complex I subunit 5 family protein [Fusibacter ferrireducens]|uniref:NADH:quinone oxidoreductase/Mrp antiporter transmembrane domain-containing protein n=1 Tax=Fusibacter ferrireducens TaxID=2785058 RepID=A0ABR9ZUV2_9FIRM|nr:proton-conducting transporter membrane subunit [Fusibacter ferrireducens]MBF4694131.1 hypothetical protein [Fusibacter ferrireducens]
MSTNLILLVGIPLVSSFVSFLIGLYNEKYRNAFLLGMLSYEAYLTLQFYRMIQYGGSIDVYISNVMGTGIVLKLNMYRYVFVVITVFAFLMTTIYSFNYLIRYEHRNRYYLFFMLTFACTIGMFVSENIINMFTFFEVLSISIYLLIIHDEDEYAHEAGEVYLNMAIFGGLVQLLGIFMLYAYTGNLLISKIGASFMSLGGEKIIISLLIFVGFAVKASLFPLHVWLPKAHPAAPSPASAILSGVMLKCGIFGILMIAKDFLNYEAWFLNILMVFGFLNMVVTGILAMYQRNLKRIMAFSSMSQIGFILVGIAVLGISKNYGTYGVLLYIVNHSLYKVLLFLCAGAIYMVVKDLSLNQLVGFGNRKYILYAVFLLGVLGLIAFPGSNGFLSKSLIYHALEEYVHVKGRVYGVLILGFEFGSMLTVAYSLKMFMAIFVFKPKAKYDEASTKQINKFLYVPLILLAIAIAYEGTHSNLIMSFLSPASKIMGGETNFIPHFYTMENIVHSLVITIFGALIYIFFINGTLRVKVGDEKIYVNPTVNWISFEKMLYRPMMHVAIHGIPKLIVLLDAYLTLSIAIFFNALHRLTQIKFKTTTDKEYSVSKAVGTMGIWVNTVSGSIIIALVATMVIYMILTV